MNVETIFCYELHTENTQPKFPAKHNFLLTSSYTRTRQSKLSFIIDSSNQVKTLIDTKSFLVIYTAMKKYESGVLNIDEKT